MMRVACRRAVLSMLFAGALVFAMPVHSQESQLTPAEKQKIRAMRDGYELGMQLNDYPASVRDARKFFSLTDIYRNDIDWFKYHYRVQLTQESIARCDEKSFNVSVGALDKELRRARELQQHFDAKAKYYNEKADALQAVFHHMIDYFGYYLEWMKRTDPKFRPLYGSDVVPDETTGIKVHPAIMIADLVFTIGSRAAEAFVDTEKRFLHLQNMSTRMNEIESYVALLRTARDVSTDLSKRYMDYGNSLEKSIKVHRDKFNARACQKRCKAPAAKAVPSRKPPVLKVWVSPKPGGEATRHADTRRDPGKD